MGQSKALTVYGRGVGESEDLQVVSNLLIHKVQELEVIHTTRGGAMNKVQGSFSNEKKM